MSDGELGKRDLWPGLFSPNAVHRQRKTRPPLAVYVRLTWLGEIGQLSHFVEQGRRKQPHLETGTAVAQETRKPASSDDLFFRSFVLRLYSCPIGTYYVNLKTP